MTIATSGLPRRAHLRTFLRSRGFEVLLALAVLGTMLGLLIGPAVMNCFCGSRRDVAVATARKYALEAYPRWSQATGLACPAHLAQLNAYMNNRDTRDPWGTEYLLRCAPAGRPGIVVVSAGEDADFGTDDDIRSDRWSRK